MRAQTLRIPSGLGMVAAGGEPHSERYLVDLIVTSHTGSHICTPKPNSTATAKG